MNHPQSMVSVIVATFNGGRQLELCLRSLMAQTADRMEIIIADDGSDSPETEQIIHKLKSSSAVTIKHARLDKDGFQLAKSRNNAVAYASGETLVFLDHDIITPPSFIKSIVSISGDQDWYLAGRRVKLDEQTSQDILSGKRAPNSVFSWSFALYALANNLEGWRYLFPLRDRGPRTSAQNWRGMAGFCIVTPRKAFEKVDGFDHIFRYYGVEDWDFLARLTNSGYRGALLPRSCTVAHLWHPEKAPDLAHENYKFLESTLKQGRIRALEGYSTLMDYDGAARIGGG